MMSYVKLTINKDTARMVEDCKKEFLSHHPEFEKIHISANKIVYEMARYYLSL